MRTIGGRACGRRCSAHTGVAARLFRLRACRGARGGPDPRAAAGLRVLTWRNAGSTRPGNAVMI